MRAGGCSPVHVRGFDAICRMVAVGPGIAVLPDRAIRPLVRSRPNLLKIAAALPMSPGRTDCPRPSSAMAAPPPLHLDPATLLFSIGVLGWLLAAVSFSTASGAPTTQRAALHAWGRAMLAGGGAFMLYFLRGHAPLWLTLLMANTLVVALGYEGLRAHALLFDEPMPRRAARTLAAFGLGFLFAAHFLGLPRQYAGAALSVALAGLFGMAVWMILRTRERRHSPLSWVGATTTGLTTLMLAIRAATSLGGTAATVSPGADSAQQIGALVLGTLFMLGASMGFFSLVHERQRRETLERARRDGLTGLYTRSAFFELAEQIDKSMPSQPYAALMVDIDHFKAINDTYGHLGGDVTLTHAARLIANSIRLSDVAGRYGGEEFSIILRNCGAEGAAAFAQRLVEEAGRQTVRLPDGRKAQFTLSVGYAIRGAQAAEAPDRVIDRADQALYRAKRSGRNRAEGFDLFSAGAPVPQGA